MVLGGTQNANWRDPSFFSSWLRSTAFNGLAPPSSITRTKIFRNGCSRLRAPSNDCLILLRKALPLPGSHGAGLFHVGGLRDTARGAAHDAIRSRPNVTQNEQALFRPGKCLHGPSLLGVRCGTAILLSVSVWV